MRACQRGFTLVSAIFILVVLAALAAFMAVISTTGQIGSAMDVQGARAYQAARAGIEWGVYQIWSSSPASRAGASCPAGAIRPATINVAIPASAATLAGFTVSVSCSATADPGGFGGPTIFSLTAVACNRPVLQADGRTRCPILSASLGDASTDASGAGGSGYVERRVAVTL